MAVLKPVPPVGAAEKVRTPRRVLSLADDPLWYKDAVIYEVHVRSFYDSVDDGMGDFAGLAQKLDYIQDLGITAIWVLPFCPSPWRDDGYDIANYTDVHPVYGTLKDFQNFLEEAHKRNLRVITELVINHTSDQHEWFQRSRRAKPGSHWRNFYVWSDTPEKYKEARIIFKDFEPSNWSWDPVAKAYYWHRFFAHQPDLNFDYEPVRQAVIDAMDFWLSMGVDGLRLDAIPYLFERDGTSCENLPETHAFLKELRAHVDRKYTGRMLLAEANQWPDDAIAYFGEGNECHMAFHFPVMPRLFMGLRMEDRHPITDILKLTPPIPGDCQWAMFLRNHDELTLEMVTDEERDYMYRVYAEDRTARINLGIRRRLAPLLGNDRRRIELMNALLFSLPGTPVIYYGDEIGMGDNFYLGDRNGVRTPMQWSADRNAGFSKANPQKLYLPVIIDPEYHYEAVNVESQLNNPNSLLWWMKRTIAQRKRSQAFGRGSLEFLSPENRKVLAFIREYQDERVMVVANLSRFTQCCELDLAHYQGSTLTEMFGGTEFPPVGDRPYLLSLGPYAFYWFLMQPKSAPEQLTIPGERRAAVRVQTVDEVFTAKGVAQMERSLSVYLAQRHWFIGHHRKIRTVELVDAVAIPETNARLLLLNVEFTEGDPDLYLLPLSFATVGENESADVPAESVVATVRTADGQNALVYTAVCDESFGTALLNAMAKRKRLRGVHGELVAAHTKLFRSLLGTDRPALTPQPIRAPQNHSNVAFADRFVLKVYRKVEPGISPEIELLKALTIDGKFANAPALAGTLEYQPKRGDAISFGLLQGFVRNAQEGWRYALDNLGLFLERALAAESDPRLVQVPAGTPLALSKEPIPPVIAELNGSFLEMSRLLGQRVGEMHAALASKIEEKDFAPEPYTDFYRQGLYHGMLGAAGRAFEALRRNLRRLPEAARPQAKSLLEREDEITKRLHRLRDRRIHANRIRVHGDLHLAQVLFTGNDFVIIDFEGMPHRALGERRIKRTALRDVASMMRSFHYAAHAALFGQVAGIVPQQATRERLEHWARVWYRWAASSFLYGYLNVALPNDLVPKDPGELDVLLDSYLIDRAMSELVFDVENRPEWSRVAVAGILGVLDAHS